MRPYRVEALSPKENRSAVPPVPCDYLLTIDIDTTADMYLQFWEPRFLGQHSNEDLDLTALEALRADYYLEAVPATIPAFDPEICYSCTLSNAGLRTLAVTLMQIQSPTRIQVLVENRDPPRASTLVQAQREIDHVLGQDFPDTRPVRTRWAERIPKGKAVRPRRLTELTLPTLPGMDRVPRVPIEVDQPAPIDGPSVPLGRFIHPITKEPTGSVHLPVDALQRHLLISGTTGAGKTNLCLKLATELSEQVPLLIFDVKRDYRSLHETIGAQVYGFTGENLFTHNFLKPEGPPSRWAKQFASILSEVISPGVRASGAKDMVIEVLDELYEERKIYEGNENYPHIGDLAEELRARGQDALSYREKNWIASAIRVLKTLSIGRTRDAFCVRTGLSIERLLSETTVVETQGIGDDAGASLLMAVLLQKIRNRLAKEPPADGLRHAIVFEEAQRLLQKGQESHSVIARACREIRSYGVGLIFLTQIPSEFSKDALANTNTLLGMKLNIPQDKRVMGQLLGLDRESEELLDGLDIGQAVLKGDQTFLVQVPEVDRPAVYDSDLSKATAEPEDVSTDAARRQDVENKVEKLSPRDRKVFLTIAASDAIYPSEIARELGYVSPEVSGCVGELIGRGLVWYLRTNLRGQKGAPQKLCFLSPDGEEAYRQHTGSYSDKGRAKGGDHKEMVEGICKARGLERLKSDRFDVLFENADGQERAIEVETGSNRNDQIETNIKKSLELQADARFVCSDQRIYNRVVQVACRYAFTKNRAFPLKIGLYDDFVDGEDPDVYDLDPPRKPPAPR